MGAIKEPTKSLYDTDFHAWTVETARALRARDDSGLDRENLIEEVESMGRSERRELASRLSQLLMHLLKWEYQWQRRSKSWASTIKVQREQTLRVLAENPSLRPKLPEIVGTAYADARLDSERETGIALSSFPDQCPYPMEQVLSSDWLPPAREGP